MGHKQVELKVDDDFYILVDEGIEDIIKNGINSAMNRYNREK